MKGQRKSEKFRKKKQLLFAVRIHEQLKKEYIIELEDKKLVQFSDKQSVKLSFSSKQKSRRKENDLNSHLRQFKSPNLGWEPVLQWKSTNPEPDRFLGIILETRG